MQEGIEKGIEKGRKEGLKKGMEKVALRMLEKGMEIQEICLFTNLKKEKVLKLKARVQK